MKNKRQYRDSAMFVVIGYVGIILVVLAMVLGVGTKKETTFDRIEMEMLGEMELHWDTINKETKDWTGTTQDSVNPYDSIASYDSFIHVPAGSDSIIMVDGILYQLNTDENKWTPLYLDEDVMWIGENGDTIWE